jgi:hypothetical protein
MLTSAYLSIGSVQRSQALYERAIARSRLQLYVDATDIGDDTSILNLAYQNPPRIHAGAQGLHTSEGTPVPPRPLDRY